MLEETGELEPRISALDDDLSDVDEEQEDESEDELVRYLVIIATISTVLLCDPMSSFMASKALL